VSERLPRNLILLIPDTTTTTLLLLLLLRRFLVYFVTSCLTYRQFIKVMQPSSSSFSFCFSIKAIFRVLLARVFFNHQK
jgi:hypothetical protein